MIVNLKGKETIFEKVVKTELKTIKETGLKKIENLFIELEEEFHKTVDKSK